MDKIKDMGRGGKKRLGTIAATSPPVAKDTKEWFGPNGELHREEGPARVLPDGTREWWIGGERHREDGPAVERPKGVSKRSRLPIQEWYRRGQLHREDGPARIKFDGSEEWYLNGELRAYTLSGKKNTKSAANKEFYEISARGKHLLHRTDGPAREYSDGSEEWYLHGKLHREGGPAVSLSDGTEEWAINGEVHRDDGPARVYPGGLEEYYRYGELHREDGPARVLVDGTEEWHKEGAFHRIGGPAISRLGVEDLKDGVPREEYYEQGQLHREDGPARIWDDGREEWWQDGKRIKSPEESMQEIEDDKAFEAPSVSEEPVFESSSAKEKRSRSKKESKAPLDEETAYEDELLEDILGL